MKLTAGRRLLLPILGAIAINAPSPVVSAAEKCVVDGTDSNTISGCVDIDYGLSPGGSDASQSGYSFR